MRVHGFVAALAATSLQGTAARLYVRQNNLPTAVENENTISLQGVLNNIGPEGSQAPGALAGVIVASPSTENPDCEYTFNAKKNCLLGNALTRAKISENVRKDSSLTLAALP
jgi:glucoamylase